VKTNMPASNSVYQLSDRQHLRTIKKFCICAVVLLLNSFADPNLALAGSVSLNVAGVSELKISALESELAKANLIGFVGGKGLSNSEGTTRNFLGTQRLLFHGGGLNFYLYPNEDSDAHASYPYRASDKNIKRINLLAKFLKKRNGLPVVLVGFSRGSVDVAQFAKSHSKDIAAIVILSGVYENDSRKAGDYSLNEIIGTEIGVPILGIHHSDDECRVTVPSEAEAFFDSLSAPKKKFVFLDGGRNTGRDCGPFHHHGFEDIERQAVNQVVQWLKQFGK